MEGSEYAKDVRDSYFSQEGLDWKTHLDNQTFMIKKGKVVDSQPEFVAFKRQNITKWGAIS